VVQVGAPTRRPRCGRTLGSHHIHTLTSPVQPRQRRKASRRWPLRNPGEMEPGTPIPLLFFEQPGDLLAMVQYPAITRPTPLRGCSPERNLAQPCKRANHQNPTRRCCWVAHWIATAQVPASQLSRPSSDNARALRTSPVAAWSTSPSLEAELQGAHIPPARDQPARGSTLQIRRESSVDPLTVFPLQELATGSAEGQVLFAPKTACRSAQAQTRSGLAEVRSKAMTPRRWTSGFSSGSTPGGAPHRRSPQAPWPALNPGQPFLDPCSLPADSAPW